LVAMHEAVHVVDRNFHRKTTHFLPKLPSFHRLWVLRHMQNALSGLLRVCKGFIAVQKLTLFADPDSFFRVKRNKKREDIQAYGPMWISALAKWPGEFEFLPDNLEMSISDMNPTGTTFWDDT